ncbi:NTP transferase domain-containing protein [Antribacter sp. KLBMP9083]|uniref:NTP transferase domain-containing protein n=1 Tax=Antribacter soli TaxID=2910976 RepID=A0AA41QAL8_9MICO|nr:NTP transferase domain-containing protein [Antribacter soli]MCF4119591.1 NTP transferase domain-containing protein [Antribacter soli]
MDDLAFDAVILAGGRASRLGGTPKPGLRTDGGSLLDRALGAAEGARRVAVVGPEDLRPGLADRVVTTREDPPFGGPVAGLAAGLAALPDAGAAPWVLVLAVDVPRAAAAVPLLLRAVAQEPQAPPGAHLTSAGRAQWLVGLYRRGVLVERLNALRAETGGVHGASVRGLVGGLAFLEVPDPGGLADDVDTWADAARLGVAAPDAAPGAASDTASDTVEDA